MRVIILAAGQGTRLRPYTNDRPKCLVELSGQPLLHRQLAVLQGAGIAPEQIALVTGYCQEQLQAQGLTTYLNPDFAQTNMVHTLFCAQDFMQPGEDLLLAYGDIIYEPRVLNTLLETPGEVVIAADRQWQRLWSLRMDNPLDDAETFKMHAGQVIELGKKPTHADQVQAQYMGLIKIRGDRVQAFIDFYQGMDRQARYDGQDFDNLYMTSLLQALIDAGWPVTPALVDNGWLEVDTAEELELYQRLHQQGELDAIIRLD